MSYHDQIRTALSYAPVELLENAGGMVEVDGSVTYSNQLDHTQRLQDSKMLRINRGRITPLNAVAVDTADELNDLLHAAVEVAHVENYDFASTVSHEDSHADFFRNIGITSCKFEVLMLRLAPTERDLHIGRTAAGFLPHTIAANVKVPKIIMAGMNARPVIPSEGDLAAIRSYGYSGIQEVGDRLRKYSERWRAKPVLLPLSYIGNE